ncbi:S8 family serine peptidase [Streptomyces sp. NPDC048211]|uniref:S8 family serine peptidase n=1 Tax=Streptomyces sp. NPDC048211 TaxID=3365516 RepID=UPI003718E67B
MARSYSQDSWFMAGMQWAAESGADVVNMSLGDTYPTDGSDPMSQTVDALSAQYGTLFVIAAGNAGPESVSAPGAASSALTVAATDTQDQLAPFSSTGPLAYSGGMKPDIAAPGVDITAARSQEMTDGGEGLYRTLSGTSMATPHLAGAAAVLAQQHPDPWPSAAACTSGWCWTGPCWQSRASSPTRSNHCATAWNCVSPTGCR